MITVLAFPLELEPNKYKLLPRKVCRYIGMLSAVVTTHRYDSIWVFPTSYIVLHPVVMPSRNQTCPSSNIILAVK
jgi:hypothetical protein